MDFYKNDLINQVLNEFYKTFSQTLDTADYVPTKYNDKIRRYIFRNMKKSMKQIERENYKHIRQVKSELKQLAFAKKKKAKKRLLKSRKK